MIFFADADTRIINKIPKIESFFFMIIIF